MNKEDLVLKLIGMLVGEGLDAGGEAKPKPLIGEFVIVRCRDAGVHAGTLVDYEGRNVELKDSRRLWYWKCANNQHTLSGVAAEGITSDSKIPAAVPFAILPEACEILSTSDKCKKSVMEAAIYEN